MLLNTLSVKDIHTDIKLFHNSCVLISNTLILVLFTIPELLSIVYSYYNVISGSFSTILIFMLFVQLKAHKRFV